MNTLQIKNNKEQIKHFRLTNSYSTHSHVQNSSRQPVVSTIEDLLDYKTLRQIITILETHRKSCDLLLTLYRLCSTVRTEILNNRNYIQ